MHCQSKQCNKPISNKRNAVHANKKVFCSHNCFIEHDLSIEKCELEAAFIKTRIGVLRQMKLSLYYLRRPHKLEEFNKRINDYRQDLKLLYNKVNEG